MTDIVERLRKEVGIDAMRKHAVMNEHQFSAMIEAADEIERLQTERDWLMKKAQQNGRELDRLTKEVIELRAELGDLPQAQAMLMTQLKETRAEVAGLREDAEIAALQIKADLLDLAVRKGLLSVHSELIDPRNHGTRCSWLEGRAKACDISNNARAALVALGDKTLTTPPPSLSPRS